jgi:hypothetical protein
MIALRWPVLALASSVALSAALSLACSTPKEQPKPRAELRKVGPSTVEVLPAPGQLPYCLLFSTSETGVTRQLTMNFEDMSVPCEAGSPVGGVPYKIPVSDGKTRIHILFSDRALKASSLAQQIGEIASTNPAFKAMDLRAPGQLLTESLEFTPSR